MRDQDQELKAIIAQGGAVATEATEHLELLHATSPPIPVTAFPVLSSLSSSRTTYSRPS
jgi:hypothetical protein